MDTKYIHTQKSKIQTYLIWFVSFTGPKNINTGGWGGFHMLNSRIHFTLKGIAQKFAQKFITNRKIICIPLLEIL